MLYFLANNSFSAFFSFCIALTPFSGFLECKGGPWNLSLKILHKFSNSAAFSLKSVKAKQVQVFLFANFPNLSFEGTIA